MLTARLSRDTRMTKPPRRRPNYDRKLTRTLALADGTRLMTLRDAADLFSERFGTVTQWRTLEGAIERVLRGAQLM
jgi:hypothetical protein